MNNDIDPLMPTYGQVAGEGRQIMNIKAIKRGKIKSHFVPHDEAIVDYLDDSEEDDDFVGGILQEIIGRSVNIGEALALQSKAEGIAEELGMKGTKQLITVAEGSDKIYPRAPKGKQLSTKDLLKFSRIQEKLEGVPTKKVRARLPNRGIIEVPKKSRTQRKRDIVESAILAPQDLSDRPKTKAQTERDYSGLSGAFGAMRQAMGQMDSQDVIDQSSLFKRQYMEQTYPAVLGHTEIIPIFNPVDRYREQPGDKIPEPKRADIIQLSYDDKMQGKIIKKGWSSDTKQNPWTKEGERLEPMSAQRREKWGHDARTTPQPSKVTAHKFGGHTIIYEDDVMMMGRIKAGYRPLGQKEIYTFHDDRTVPNEFYEGRTYLRGEHRNIGSDAGVLWRYDFSSKDIDYADPTELYPVGKGVTYREGSLSKLQQSKAKSEVEEEIAAWSKRTGRKAIKAIHSDKGYETREDAAEYEEPTLAKSNKQRKARVDASLSELLTHEIDPTKIRAKFVDGEIVLGHDLVGERRRSLITKQQQHNIEMYTQDSRYKFKYLEDVGIDVKKVLARKETPWTKAIIGESGILLSPGQLLAAGVKPFGTEVVEVIREDRTGGAGIVSLGGDSRVKVTKGGRRR